MAMKTFMLFSRSQGTLHGTTGLKDELTAVGKLIGAERLFALLNLRMMQVQIKVHAGGFSAHLTRLAILGIVTV